MLDKIKAIIQLILPKQCLTQCAGWLAEKKWGFFTHWMIKGFAKLYRVDLSEAKLEKAEEYQSFNEFFARELKEGQRPVDENPNSLVSPADGKVSQFGDIRQDDLLQAKGHFYSLSSLVACDDLMSQKFYDGHFITTYLSPKDYHRVHMPCDAELKEMIYVPGSLFSVNEATTRNIDNIFARNERIICLFETAFGPMIQILVGATIVGTIETTWQGKVTPPRDGLIKKWHYTRGEVTFKKGDEMGCFKLGSTVINLFTKGAIEFNADLTLGQAIKMGESFGNRR